MGIISKIKRRLPIVGAGGSSNPRPSTANDSAQPSSAAAGPVSAPSYETRWEEPSSPRGDQPVAAFIDEFVKSNKIVIFMKGSPDAPKCGFSANASAMLRSYDKTLTHFDVFLDPEVRQGVKEYSQWPTLPQIYVGGEFMGGSDIVSQMHQSGELREEIDKAFAAE